jgi:hypothetical protein
VAEGHGHPLVRITASHKPNSNKVC